MRWFPRWLRGNDDWHDIFRRDCAQEIKRCKKPGLPERVRTNAQAVLRLAWGGLAKGNQSVQQVEASVVSQKSPGGHLAKGTQSVQQAKVTGLGDSQGLGAQGLGPGLFLFSPSPLLKPSNTPPKVGG